MADPMERLPSVLMVLLLGTILPFPLAGQRYNFHHYTSLEGIPQRQVQALHQDPTGFLWFGTYGGLSRYDGVEFFTLTTRHGLAANPVYEIADDGEGGLWVGTERGVCRLREFEPRCVVPEDGLATGAVTALAREEGTGLWVGTEDGLSLVEPSEDVQTFDLGETPGGRTIGDLALGTGGTLWVGTDRGLFRRNGRGRFEPVWRSPGRPEINALLILPEGDLLVGTTEGLWNLRTSTRGEVRVRRLDLPAGGTDEEAGRFVTALAREDTGRVWVGTQDGAVSRDGNRDRRFTTENGLLSDLIHEIVVDREGNVWFGTDAGSSKLVPGPIVTYQSQNGLPHPFVRTLELGPRGRLWMGTRDGLARLDGSGVVDLGPLPGLPSSRIYGLAALGPERLLIATWEGLAEWSHGKVLRSWSRAHGLPSSYTTTLEPDGEGGLWVGTSEGLARWKEGTIERTADEILSVSYVVSMHRTPDGSLWVGTRSKGLVLFDGESRRRHLDEGNGLTSEAVWDLDLDERGRVWAGTNGDGVFRIDGDEIVRLTSREGLVNDFVWQVHCDRSGHVWFYTSRGLDRLEEDRWIHYGAGDGLVDLEGSAGAVVEDRDELWFGTGTGIVRYRRDQEAPVLQGPKVILLEALDSRGTPLTSGAEIPAVRAPLTLRFAALTFRNENAVRYRYRLLGLSREWSGPRSDRLFTLAGLKSGKFQLQVQAHRGDGVWSPEPAAFRFTVLPRPWQTWPVRIGLALLLVGTVLALVSLRTRKLRRDRRRLEVMVERRTRELEETNRRLRHLASVDDLTQLANRRRFFQTLGEELRRLNRSDPGTGLSLFLLDLDLFKRVNDEHGHLIGDRVLKRVADRLRDAVRATDRVARYGGEEFAAILPETGARGARKLAEKVRSRIQHEPFEVEGRTISLTASLGITTLERPGSGEIFEPDVDRLLQRVDDALYRAKEEGRNRVVVS